MSTGVIAMNRTHEVSTPITPPKIPFAVLIYIVTQHVRLVVPPHLQGSF